MDFEALDDLQVEELRQAVAIYYDGSRAPTVVAKGVDSTAEEIIRLALEHDVPLCDNSALVDLLCQLEIGDNIPQELYLAVSYILSFAYELSDKTPPDTVS